MTWTASAARVRSPAAAAGVGTGTPAVTVTTARRTHRCTLSRPGSDTTGTSCRSARYRTARRSTRPITRCCRPRPRRRRGRHRPPRPDPDSWRDSGSRSGPRSAPVCLGQETTSSYAAVRSSTITTIWTTTCRRGRTTAPTGGRTSSITSATSPSLRTVPSRPTAWRCPRGA